jgi:hypothetical protein
VIFLCNLGTNHISCHKNVSNIAEQYNTTDDVFEFLENSNNLHFFQSKETTRIALCFKNEPLILCSPTPDGDAWKSLVTDIFNRGQTLINSGKYNIEFILDGGATPSAHPCLKDLWRPWNSTWINSPLGAFDSNDPVEGYDRFQVYNSFANEEIVKMAAFLDWGKFSKGKYPLQIWEPCDEDDFSTFNDIYLWWAKNHSSYHEFNFAINIDPKQFMIYNARKSGKAIHELLFSSGVTPKILLVPTDQTNESFSQFAIVLYWNPSTFNISYGVSKIFINDWGYPQLDKNIAVGQLLNKNNWLNNIESASLKYIDLSSSAENTSLVVFVSDSFGHFAFYHANPRKWTSISLIRQGTFFTRMQAAIRYSTAKIIFQLPQEKGTTGGIYVGQLYSADAESCSLFFILWFFKSPNARPTQISEAVCIASHISVSTSSLALVMNHTCLANRSPNKRDHKMNCVIEGLITFSDSSQQIHASYLCLSTNEHNEFIICAQRTQIQTHSVVIDVGNFTNVAIHPQSGIIIETHGEGYCYNTEYFNKRPIPKVCSSLPFATPNVLNYNIGTIQQWRSFLFNSSEKIKFITSCNTNILHGTYDQGRSPHADLFVFGKKVSTQFPSFTSSSGSYFLGLVAVHEGYRSSDIDLTICGRPHVFVPNSTNGGIVIDGVLF